MSAQDAQRGDARVPPHAFLLAVVSVTGAIVLALEVLGTRIIGTYYGSSLYVWAALLSVTMVCLAVGYAVGGRIADRHPKPAMLYSLLLCAGASILLVPLFAGVLAPVGDLLGLAWGAIACALIIFFLPLTLLATAGPYVIRLRAQRLEGVGATSGVVYAVSTCGSVAGVLVVSLLMIPTLGTRSSLYVCSGLLMAVGSAGLILSAGLKRAPVLLCALLPVLVAKPEAAVSGQIFRTESAFGDLRVIEQQTAGRGRYRMLMVNGIMQTGMPLDMEMLGAASLLTADSYYLELLPYFYPELGSGRRGILIGLAGGMFARVMDNYNVDLTAVEIDVKVAELAQAYFGYRGDIFLPSGKRHIVDLSRFPVRRMARPPGAPELEEPSDRGTKPAGRAVIQDGRQFLAVQTGAVDFIVLDAYNSDSIPFHLITREFFELTRNRLNADGILAINYIGRPERDFVTDSLFRTLAEVYGEDHLLAYRTRGRRDEVQVMAVFAFRRRMELLPLWAGAAPGQGVDPLSYELSQRREHPDFSRGVVITDDFNPIDRARIATALEWRQRTTEALR